MTVCMCSELCESCQCATVVSATRHLTALASTSSSIGSFTLLALAVFLRCRCVYLENLISTFILMPVFSKLGVPSETLALC